MVAKQSTTDKHVPSRYERRLRFVSAESSRTPGSRIDVHVTLALQDPGEDSDDSEVRFSGEASGVGDVILEPRLAVEATLAAIAEATGDPGYFRLVGIKVVHAFDTRVVLVCLRTSDDRSVQVVGAVPLVGEMARTAAKAALDATNRLVAIMLDRTKDSANDRANDQAKDPAAGLTIDEAEAETEGDRALAEDEK